MPSGIWRGGPLFNNKVLIPCVLTICDRILLVCSHMYLYVTRVLMGDTNINTLTKTSVSRQSERFNQLIFEATRVTEHSHSCIDHIFANISTCSSGSLAVELADHLPVLTILY